jgi:hypothetical protein
MLIRAGGVTVFPHGDATAAPAKARPKKRGHVKPRRRS